MERAMKMILAIWLIAAGLSLPAKAWDVIELVDVMTDQKTRRACGTDDGQNLICAWFQPDEGKRSAFWLLMKLPDSEARSLDTRRYPWVRIDSHEVAKDNLVDLERLSGSRLIPRNPNLRWISWRAVVQNTPTAPWHCNKHSVLNQMQLGSRILFRAAMIGGFQRDTAMALTGFKDAIVTIGGGGIDASKCKAPYVPSEKDR
jgi:hypothetical protein